MTEFGPEYNYPKLKGPSSKPLLGGATVGIPGNDGASAIFVASQTNNLLIPTDSDGLNPVYTNAITEFEIWDGNTLLAIKSALDGWTSSVITVSNCTVDDTIDLQATVVTITADEAYFLMQFDKVGYNSLTAKVYVKKVRDGEKGDQGIPGTPGGVGPDGPVGATGADGTGLVVVKKTIDVLAYTYFISGASDSGGLLFASSVPHEMSVGDTVHHYAYTVYTQYNGDHKVVEIVSTTTYRVETLVYAGEDGGNGYSLSGLRPSTNDDSQDLEWYDMIPPGSALMEVRLIMITEDDSNEVYAYLGWKRYPTAGWNFYINGSALELPGEQYAYPPTSSNYLVWLLRGSSSYPGREDLHLRLTPYIGRNWNIDYLLVKFNLLVSYISYPLDAYNS